MKTTEVKAAFEAGKGTKLGGKLYLLDGVFYEKRNGAVPFVKAKNQERLANRYGLTVSMATAKVAAEIQAAPVAKVVGLITPPDKGRKGWVRDYLAHARKMGVIS